MNLIESTKRYKDDRVRWLEEAKEAANKVALLPKEIQELEGAADCDLDMELEIRLTGGDEAIEICRKAGVIFDKPRMYGYGPGFGANGRLGDTRIVVYELSTPPECRVEKESYTAYRYKAICNESGEKVQ